MKRSIVVGLIFNAHQQILIARRPEKSHLGGYWEFPGGKIKNNETPQQALARELQEEVGIKIKASEFFKSVFFDYGDRQVNLSFYRITDYQGEPQGSEGQEIRWSDVSELKVEDFPTANRSIVHALQLPPFYVIFEKTLPTYDLVQFRAPNLSKIEYRQQAENYLTQLNSKQTLFINSDIEFAKQHAQVGLHLNSRTLMQCEERPISTAQWLAASCHNLIELRQAEKIQVDFVTLSPVAITKTHAQVQPLGWQQFHELVQQTYLPVYALGGMTHLDVDLAKSYGAVGVAGIRGFYV